MTRRSKQRQRIHPSLRGEMRRYRLTSVPDHWAWGRGRPFTEFAATYGDGAARLTSVTDVVGVAPTRRLCCEVLRAAGFPALRDPNERSRWIVPRPALDFAQEVRTARRQRGFADGEPIPSQRQVVEILLFCLADPHLFLSALALSSLTGREARWVALRDFAGVDPYLGAKHRTGKRWGL